MRIGLFTDTYRPTINGITFVVESLKRNLEADGHTVYVFCPARTMMPSIRRLEGRDYDDNFLHDFRKLLASLSRSAKNRKDYSRKKSNRFDVGILRIGRKKCTDNAKSRRNIHWIKEIFVRQSRCLQKETRSN